MQQVLCSGGYNLIDCGTGDYTVLCDESLYEAFRMLIHHHYNKNAGKS